MHGGIKVGEIHFEISNMKGHQKVAYSSIVKAAKTQCDFLGELKRSDSKIMKMFIPLPIVFSGKVQHFVL